MKNHLFILVIILLSVACGKKDITKNVTVSGNVRNNCTGGPFTGVTVKFTTTHEKSFGKTESDTRTSVTDNNGNFSFTNLDINNSDKYKYFLSIDTYSNYDYEFFGISPQELDKNTISNPYQIGVSATFKNCFIQLPTGINVYSPDTFSLAFEQRTLHIFEPNRIWQAYRYPRNLNPGSSYAPNWGNYPMGWWHITLNKTKAGVSTVIKDSIYMDMGGTNTYTIPW